jgi:outer membrane protein assembly factor BamB
MIDVKATYTGALEYTLPPTKTSMQLANTEVILSPTISPTLTRTVIPIINQNDYFTGWPQFGYDTGKTNWNRLEDKLSPPLNKAWNYEPPNKNIIFGTALISSGRVVLFTSNLSNLGSRGKSEVYLLDAKSGNFITSIPYNDLAPSIWNDTLYYGQDNNLCALKLTTLAQNCFYFGTTNIKFGGLIFYKGKLLLANKNRVLSYDLTMGMDEKVLYEIKGEYLLFQPLIDNGVLIIMAFAESGQTLITIAADISTGTELWRKETTTTNYSDALDPSVASDGILISAPSNGNLIQAYNEVDGTLIWERTFPYKFRNTMAVANHILYVSEANYAEDRIRSNIEYPFLYAINIYTGEIINKRQGLSEITSIVGANDVIYVSSAHDGIYALDPLSLEILWEDHCYCVSYLAVADGKLFLTAQRFMTTYIN